MTLDVAAGARAGTWSLRAARSPTWSVVDMRCAEVGPVLTVRGIAGLHVVMLAWDFTKPPKVVADKPLPKAIRGMLGFRIVREELDAAGEVLERYCPARIKRFKDKDEGLPPGALVSLDERPVSRSFGDYTAKPGTTYRYTVTPMLGKPKLLEAATDQATTVEVTTEVEVDAAGGEPGTHEVHFNRGVIGSQAYARKFPDERPDPEQPNSAPMKWLSRGLYEALLRFIGRASDERFGLRGAFYEFHYQPVANAFRAAFDNGADVRIVFDAESNYAEENLQVLTTAGLNEVEVAFPRTVKTGIRHNKFIVLLKDDQPVAVWTGSTNISDGGIFGALQCWACRVGPGSPRRSSSTGDGSRQPALGRCVPTTRAVTLSCRRPSPHDRSCRCSAPGTGGASTRSRGMRIGWPRRSTSSASRWRSISTTVFSTYSRSRTDVLRYIVKDDDLGARRTIGVDHDVLFAGGGLGEGALANFLAEPGNP